MRVGIWKDEDVGASRMDMGCGPSWLEIQSVDLVGAGACLVADDVASIYGMHEAGWCSCMYYVR
jgi:hypothetical protein